MNSLFKILVVDDSALYQQAISRLLNEIDGVQVVSTASNGKEALEKIVHFQPHLLTLDMEMPVMDGLATLKVVREQYPALMCLVFSHHTEAGAEITLKALKFGATDFVTKPAYGGAFQKNYQAMRDELIPRIRSLVAEWRSSHSRSSSQNIKNRLGQSLNALFKKAPRDAIAIGSSTGGPNCLMNFFGQLSKNFNKSILIVQHMPPIFTQKLAEQLSRIGTVPVKEAVHGEIVKPGMAYLAPGDYHMEVVPKGNDVMIRLHQGEKENFCRPAVDVLFRSVARAYGKKAIGMILTGMGSDGLKGSIAMKEAGAPIIAQDKETSVVWGMPGFVVSQNLADAVVPDHQLYATIKEFMR
ncbi:MAG: chemotaxis response regulator protein-glutamate methylesterase [candidate division KSB1 bacterium]|nr:chemotaxis response regulator protein-glutamate methylesterase [candidate division KSB1 bacterium]